MPKIYAPRLIREAREKCASLQSRLYDQRRWYSMHIVDLIADRERAAQHQDHTWLEYLDKEIDNYHHRVDKVKQEYAEAKAQLRVLLEKYTDGRPGVAFTLKDTDEFEEYVSAKERISHRGGFLQAWVPTRRRYWRPTNNNWKKHRKSHWRTPGVSFKGVG